MSTYRLIEFEMIDEQRGPWEIASVKRIKQIIECDDKALLRRIARKNGIKIRGNDMIEISTIPYEPDCD